MGARIVSVNVGRCRPLVVADGATLETAIGKSPQNAPVMLTANGFEGDETSPEPAHGGPNRAVHVFAVESYAIFEARAGRALPRPTFGENLTVEGYDETIARVGDVIAIGEARAQVSMPTERCAKPGRLAGEPRLLKWILETLRSGFYLRVLEPGRVEPGATLEVVDRGREDCTIERLNDHLHRHIEDASLIRDLDGVDALAPEWKKRLRVLYERHTGASLA